MPDPWTFGWTQLLTRSFYFESTHVIDPARELPAERGSYWLQLGGVDGEEAEGLGLDRRWGGDQGKAVSSVEGGGHLVEGAGGEIAQQALEAVNRTAIGGKFAGALGQGGRGGVGGGGDRGALAGTGGGVGGLKQVGC